MLLALLFSAGQHLNIIKHPIKPKCVVAWLCAGAAEVN